MKHWPLATVFAVALLAARAPAQEAVRYRWQAGQVLVYKAEQATLSTETVADSKVELRTSMKLTKRWQVMSVAPTGVATVQLSLLALRYETKSTNSDLLVFDSAEPDKSTPELTKQLSKFINAPLATLLIDSQGKVIEVKESKFGPASRYENEPPFVGVLPTVALTKGTKWERGYQITPESAGAAADKVAAAQTYVCKELTGSLATIVLTTEVKAPPKDAASLVPLLGVQPEGEFVFDLKAGRLQSASLKIDKQVKGYPTPEGVYRFQSTYSEQFVSDR